MPPQTTQAPQTPPVQQGSQHRTLMGVLSYLGILVIIPLLVARDDSFVKFHVKQGLVLLIIEIAMWFVVGAFLWQFWMFLQLINLVTLVLSIMGIVNVVQGKEKELPLVGSLARHLPF